MTMKISYKHENFVSIYVIIFQIWTFCFGYTFLQDTLQLITLKIWLNFASTIFFVVAVVAGVGFSFFFGNSLGAEGDFSRLL